MREAEDDEDDRRQGAWMVQTAQPHEHAEDPLGMQRPVDRDDRQPADEHADAVSELPEARLVRTPERPKEVLLCDDPPQPLAHAGTAVRAETAATIPYPEWDCETNAYRLPGALVRVRAAPEGDPGWVARTLASHASVLSQVRRRFEMLRAQRVRLRRQPDGEDIDLDAWIDAHADRRAGLPLPDALYRTDRRLRRDLAVQLLIDASGSTEAWIDRDRRIVDVARDALLLVGVALDGLHAPWSILSFSGEGAQEVTLREIKRFDERYGAAVELRIAGLEPDRFTRVGAALRHATAQLMHEPVRHRLLLLISDGKPNDVDHYDGRYGVEDMRQAAAEARLQGVHPFCLTIDRQAPAYVPAAFGAGRYAVLSQPAALPVVLVDRLRRLLAGT